MMQNSLKNICGKKLNYFKKCSILFVFHPSVCTKNANIFKINKTLIENIKKYSSVHIL